MPISIPKFIKTAFASFGQKNNIPETTNNVTGAAGYNQGFGEINMLPEGAGGIPPDGKDFNGILYEITSSVQYLQSGVSFPFDQDFANSIGGYRVKAVVADPSNPIILWQNNTANNTLPPSVPNGWEQVLSTSDLLRDPTELLRGAPLQATQAQAEAGTNNTTMTTPLRVFQAIRSASAVATEALRGVLRVGSQPEVNAGLLDNVAVTPKKLRSGFSVDLSVNGHMTFPSWMGGLIVQWGYNQSGGSGSHTIPWNFAFPTSCLNSYATCQGTGGSGSVLVNKTTTTAAVGGFVSFNTTSGAFQNNSYVWLAIGK